MKVQYFTANKENNRKSNARKNLSAPLHIIINRNSKVKAMNPSAIDENAKQSLKQTTNGLNAKQLKCGNKIQHVNKRNNRKGL